MISLNRIDLEYLLRQVTINYLDANGDPAAFNYSQLANALDPSGIREVSGQNNNLVGYDVATNTPGPNSTWGQADQPFLNLASGQSSASAPDAAYAQVGSPVSDADPRLISNLVSTMYTAGLYANPAALQAAADAGGSVGSDPNATAFIPNAGVLGGGRYNQWFVAFGQFFDHGLDFIGRDTDPTHKITIALSPNDPLYSLGADGVLGGTGANADVTTISVRRAAVANAADAGIDGIFGSSDDVGYSIGADLMAGTADDIYAQAKYTNKTGLLIDQSQTYGSHASVNALIREYTSDGKPTGRVVSGNTGVLTDVIIGNEADAKGVATWADVKLNALRIGVDLEDLDIHNAPVLKVDPAGKLLFTPDGTLWTTAAYTGSASASDPFERNADGTVKLTGQDMLIDFNPFVALDQHIITGDGRGNENIGLTAVHNVFHEEHNTQVQNIKDTIAATNDAVFIAEWQTSPGVWDGEKLFQAARLITETEYNHVAIDQYVGTLYGALPEFVSYSSDINMGVSLEFSQSVFRLGHSMLTETFQSIDPVTNVVTDVPLLQAFLNPGLYQALTPEALTLGLTQTLGNEVDEFVTPALQQSLLGQPLDLAAINIARGRDVGLPTLNELRQQVYDGLIQTGGNGSALAPYTSWSDFGNHLKHSETLTNMIAAYGRDESGVWGLEAARASGDVQAMRAAAQAIIDAYTTALDPNHDTAVQFMDGAPFYNETTEQWEFTAGDLGFWDVDLWIGGLAERPLFDGPLGTTFSYVILDFAQRQQDGDRFYYLYRLPPGSHLGDQIIAEQFGDLVMRTTGLEHLSGDVFIRNDATFILDGTTSTSDVDANTIIHDFFDAGAHTITYVDGTTGPASFGHITIAGLEGNDFIIAGLGDDTVYGDAGNDTIQGGQGNDHLYGGDGDDLITDDENDDFIHGGAGNDRIFAGGGALDTIHGGLGDDEVHGGDGIDEVFGSEGDDLLFGEGDTDLMLGEDGNDYLNGGDGPDEMFGGFGNDWLRGGVGDDGLAGEAGNDLLEGGLGASANDGDRLLGGVLPGGRGTEIGLAFGDGFDIASYEDVDIAITANLQTSNENGQGGLLDTYALLDGLVGSRFNDTLTGADADTITTNGADNMLVGGAGNDVLIGLGGDDQIFGDGVVVRNDLSAYLGPASAYTAIANWKGTGDDRPDFGLAGGLGHFLGDNATALNPDGGADKAIFSGQLSDYTVTPIDATTVRLVDNRGIDSTVIGDLVKDVELFQFSNGAGGTVTLTLAQLLNEAPTDIQWTGIAPTNSDLPGAGAIIATLGTVDPDSGSWTYTLQAGSAANFVISAAGIVTRTLTPMVSNTTYSLVVRSTDDLGAHFDETFTIRTNGNGNTNMTPFATAGDDIMYADDGNDILSGGAGDDTLFGQDENDTLDGGKGNDMLHGGFSDTDTATYLSATGAVTVSLALFGQQDTTGAGLDTLIDIENLTGSAFDDTLTGNAGANTLNGGGGNDTLVAAIDNLQDVFIGGLGIADTIDYSAYTAGLTVDIDGNTATRVTGSGNNPAGPVDNRDTIQSIENVIGGSVNDSITGDGNGNVFTGGGGNDELNGEGGADTLDGGQGIDSLDGGSGADTLIGGAGNDIMDGGTGFDSFVFAAGFGNDVIQNFDANPAGGGQDRLDIIAYNFMASDVGNTAAFNVYVQDVGSSTLVTIGSDTFLLLGVTGTMTNSITSADFIF